MTNLPPLPPGENGFKPPAPAVPDVPPPPPGYGAQAQFGANYPVQPEVPAADYSQQIPQGTYIPQPYGLQQQPVAPPAPSAFGLTVSALWFAQWKAWSGKPEEVVHYADRVEQQTGNRWMAWFLTTLLNSLLVGVAWIVFADFRNTLLPFGGFGSSYYSSEPTVLIFFWAVFAWFAAYLFRGLGVWWSLRAAGSEVGFGRAMTIYSAAKSLLWFPLAIFVFLALARVFVGAPQLILCAVFVAVAVGVLSQVVLFLTSKREADAAGAGASAFKWYIIYTAGAALSYSGALFVGYLLLLFFGALG